MRQVAAAAEAAAYQAVHDENLTLVRSESSKTGFKCVSYNKALGLRPYKLKVSGRDLGTFSTPVEAALAYARHMAAAADAIGEKIDRGGSSSGCRRAWLETLERGRRGRRLRGGGRWCGGGHASVPRRVEAHDKFLQIQ